MFGMDLFVNVDINWINVLKVYLNNIIIMYWKLELIYNYNVTPCM